MHNIEVHIPATHPENNPNALTLEEFELLLWITWFREKVMSVVLGRSQDPQEVIQKIKEEVRHSGLTLSDLCIAELPWFRSNNSVQRELLDRSLRSTLAMIAIDRYSLLNWEIDSESSSDNPEDPILVGPNIGRNPKYTWYRRMREKEKRRNVRKIKIRMKKGVAWRDPNKSDRGTGNRPTNIF